MKKVELRWPPLNSVIPVTDIFGMYVVEKGQKYESRVTLVTKLYFGEEAGWLAQLGSKMPSVLKAGIKSGFVGSVKVCGGLKSGRYK